MIQYDLSIKTSHSRPVSSSVMSGKIIGVDSIKTKSSKAVSSLSLLADEKAIPLADFGIVFGSGSVPTKLAIKELEKKMEECVDTVKLQTLTMIWKENREKETRLLSRIPSSSTPIIPTIKNLVMYYRDVPCCE